MRKGATGYTASGSTACPPITAVNIRGGWSLGGVQNTYMRYEAAGDMYVGHTVTGLPINSSKFAILPPHFVGLDASFIHECLGIFFQACHHICLELEKWQLLPLCIIVTGF